MSATILLARHGAHDEVGRVLSGRSEIALNEIGRAQAHRLAARLRRASIETIYTSPRRRTRETADIVARGCGLEPIAAAGLDEIDFGEWSGRSFAHLATDARWRAWNAARGRAETPGGETMAGVTRRALRVVEACAAVGLALCVSHCDVIRGLVAHYLGLDADRLLSFDIDPASVTTIELSGGRGRIVAVNERLS